MRWIGRAWWCILGLGLVFFLLAPFLGAAMIYTITDAMRGHPHTDHGTRPPEFVGMWIQEQPVQNAYREWAFFLMEDSTVANLGGTSKENWHYDDGRLSIDRVSRCGNCYSGIMTTDFLVEFDGLDRMRLTPADDKKRSKRIGWYRRVPVDAALRAEMEVRVNDHDELLASQARTVLRAIERYEAFVAEGRR